MAKATKKKKPPPIGIQQRWIDGTYLMDAETYYHDGDETPGLEKSIGTRVVNGKALPVFPPGTEIKNE
jgi:hypothetical protein